MRQGAPPSREFCPRGRSRLPKLLALGRSHQDLKEPCIGHPILEITIAPFKKIRFVEKICSLRMHAKSWVTFAANQHFRFSIRFLLLMLLDFPGHLVPTRLLRFPPIKD